MRKISMYWNNICVLHRYEKKHIEEVTALLREQDILLETEYFGLGYAKKLSEDVKSTGAAPDIIVSTDLEVFEDPENTRLISIKKGDSKHQSLSE